MARSIPFEEAIAVDRPDVTLPSNSIWSWSEPINAIVSNSRRWSHAGDVELLTWPEVLEAARCAIEDLYRCGFAVIKVDREPQPLDGPDYHADHAAWRERTASKENAR